VLLETKESSIWTLLIPDFLSFEAVGKLPDAGGEPPITFPPTRGNIRGRAFTTSYLVNLIQYKKFIVIVYIFNIDAIKRS